MMSHAHDDHDHGHSHSHSSSSSEHEKLMLKQDLEDLLALLEMRFGTIPPDVYAEIGRIDKLDTMQRLILVAANAADWNVFVQELKAGDGAFKLVGDHLSPI